MKRFLSFLIVLLILCSCVACNNSHTPIRPYRSPEKASASESELSEEPKPETLSESSLTTEADEPTESTDTFETEPAPEIETYPAIGPEDILLPSCFDPNAPDGDTASRRYAALMDSLAEKLIQYDGSQGEIFTVTIQDPFSIPKNERFDYFDTLLLHTVRENPIFFWINLGKRSNTYDEKTNTVTFSIGVFPEFCGKNFDPAEEAFYKALNRTVSEIFRPSMSDMEKVLSAMGWLVQYVQYDQAMGWDAYSAYSTLVDRSAVCHGSAVTMNLLMKIGGIDCCTVLSHVPSQDYYHVWNAVKVNGSWYNLDPTASAIPGTHSYNYFMKSTVEMLDGNSHYEHITRMHISCDRSYSGDTPWATTNTAFLYSDEHKALLNVENCTLQNGKLYLANPSTYRAITINNNGKATEKSLSSISANVSYCTPEYRGRLYYMTYEGEIWAHDLSTGKGQLMISQNYKGYPLYLNEDQGILLILDGNGKTIKTLSVSQ